MPDFVEELGARLLEEADIKSRIGCSDLELLVRRELGVYSYNGNEGLRMCESGVEEDDDVESNKHEVKFLPWVSTKLANFQMNDEQTELHGFKSVEKIVFELRGQYKNQIRPIVNNYRWSIRGYEKTYDMCVRYARYEYYETSAELNALYEQCSKDRADYAKDLRATAQAEILAIVLGNGTESTAFAQNSDDIIESSVELFPRSCLFQQELYRREN